MIAEKKNKTNYSPQRRKMKKKHLGLFEFFSYAISIFFPISHMIYSRSDELSSLQVFLPLLLTLI